MGHLNLTARCQHKQNNHTTFLNHKINQHEIQLNSSTDILSPEGNTTLHYKVKHAKCFSGFTISRNYHHVLICMLCYSLIFGRTMVQTVLVLLLLPTCISCKHALPSSGLKGAQHPTLENLKSTHTR